MGFDEGNIILDSDNGAYYTGQTIRGRLVFDQGKVKSIHGISIDFKGFCKVHWTSERTRRENDRQISYTVNHDSHEEYFRQKSYVFGDAGGEYHLNPGHHEFKFEFHVPNDCPGSFEGSDGHIRYRVKVVMLTTGMFSSNKEKMIPVRVIAPIDLNQQPQAKEPMELELSQSYCCWCVSSGSSDIQVKAPVAGFCPGQVIPLEVSCDNPSSVDIDEIKFSLKKNTKFTAMNEHGEHTDYETVLKVTKGPIPAGSTRNWTVELEIPAMDIVNLSNCRYIEIYTYLKVSTDVSGCHEGSEECYPVIIGSIPLVGFQDNVQNPLQDQMPQVQTQNLQNVYPPPPIINQPTYNQYPGNVQPYPGSPYPEQYPSNTPYPTGTPGFQGNPAPYPGSPNSGPYPGQPTGSPYPGGPPTGSPYPGGPPTGSPYPGGPPIGSPYPGAPNPGIPPTGLPYPGGPPAGSPYPGAPNPGIPPAGSPYPPNPLPYPGAQNPGIPPIGSPYPAAPYGTGSPAGPYPGHPGPPVTTASLVQSPGFGFTTREEGKSPESMPLLPQGANVPYPPTPYSSASAPVPSTPGSDTKIPEIKSDNPPFNPDYKEEKKEDKKE